MLAQEIYPKQTGFSVQGGTLYWGNNKVMILKASLAAVKGMSRKRARPQCLSVNLFDDYES